MCHTVSCCAYRTIDLTRIVTSGISVSNAIESKGVTDFEVEWSQEEGRGRVERRQYTAARVAAGATTEHAMESFGTALAQSGGRGGATNYLKD